MRAKEADGPGGGVSARLSGSTWQRVASLIEASGLERPCSLRRAARLLAMSPRTLQRRLEEEGLTHRAVIAMVRRAAAMRLLDEHGSGLAQVSARVGFSETAAFYRAFKRWTGMTPGGFRRDRRSEREQHGEAGVSSECVGGNRGA